MTRRLSSRQARKLRAAMLSMCEVILSSGSLRQVLSAYELVIETSREYPKNARYFRDLESRLTHRLLDLVETAREVRTS